MIDPGVRISVSAFATKEMLRRVQKAAKDLTPVLEGPITNDVHRMFAMIWQTRGAYIGRTWAPLAPSTLRAKARVNRSAMGPLRKYNLLWASLTKRSNPGGFRLVTPHSLTIGTGVFYGAFHQLGTKHMPARPIVPSDDEVPEKHRQKWESLIAQYLEAA